MFTNAQRQVERTGRHGTPRDQHLQNLVTQFQNSTDEESKERIVANLANFAYDPYNYAFMRQVNYALGALYYLCNPSTKKEILKPDVLRVLREYAAAGDVNTSFNNLANAFLDKHVNS